MGLQVAFEELSSDRRRVILTISIMGWSFAYIPYTYPLYPPGSLGYLPRCSAHRATPARPQVGGWGNDL